MTVELNAGWETASTVRCLGRRLQWASTPTLPPIPPKYPQIKTDKNISSHFRTSRSLTPISPPWAFLLKTLYSLTAFLNSVQLFLSALYVFLSPNLGFLFLFLHRTHSSSASVFCPHSGASAVCLEGVMCANSDPGDHQPPGSGHPLAGAKGFFPAQH